MGDELTQDEVYALARAFPAETAATVLSLAGFPSYAVPRAGFSTALDFWSVVAEQVALGVMADGRAKILAAARRRFPSNPAFGGAGRADSSSDREPGGEPATDRDPPPGRRPGPAVTITGSQGIQVGDGNTQYNVYRER